TDLQGAVARAQLAKLEGVVARRQASARKLTALLGNISGVTVPLSLPRATHTYWKYAIVVDPEAIAGGADALGRALEKRGIACAPRYIRKPAFLCKVFTERKTYGKSRCPYSCRVRDGGDEIVYDSEAYPGTMVGLERVVVLPWNEFYLDEHVEFIAASVREA